MDMPTRSGAGPDKPAQSRRDPGNQTRNGIETALGAVKPEIRRMQGYVAPPQGNFRAKLNQNENPYDVPARVKEEILKEMQDLEWTRYPDYNPPSVREALARQLSIHPDQMLVGGGSNQLLYMVGLAVLAPGDGVMIAPPTFGLFDLIGNFYGGRLITADLKPDFSFDEALVIRSAKQAKLTFIASPNNPTGNAMPLDLLEAVLNASPGLVLWDEAYAEFSGVTAVPLLEKYANLLVLRTFSKAFGLAGLRIGYLMGRRELIAEFSKVNIPYNVNLFSELTALRLLKDRKWMEQCAAEIVKERDALYRNLRGFPEITAFPSEANFILIRFADAAVMFRRLKEKGVLLRAVNGHPLLKNCLRATVGTPEENRIFLEALRESLKES